MAYTTPQTWTNTTLTTTDLNREVRDNITELGTRCGVQLQRAANQSIANNSATNITWDTEIGDTNAFFTAPGTTITIATGKSGIYLITFALAWAGSPGSGAWMGIACGGINFRTPAINDLSQGYTIMAPLSATVDTIVASVYQNSGGAVNATGYLTALRLGL